EKDESVSRINLPNGADALELKTVIKQPRDPGDIVEAGLTVRSADWHAVSQTIRTNAKDAIKVFVVSELEFRVTGRNTLADNFFDGTAPLVKVVSPVANPSPDALSEPPAVTGESPETAPPAPTSGPSVTATADLAAEIMRLLHQAGAVIDDQTDVTRTSDGELQINGLVDSEE